MSRALVVSCAHGRDDGRVAARFASTFKDWGYRLTWVGPATLRLGEPAVTPDEERLYAQKPGRLGRIANVFRTAWRLLPLVRHRFDLVYCPEPDSALLAVLLLRRSSHIVFDVHEVYHRQQLLRWVNSEKGRRAASRALERMLCFVGKRCSVVIGVNDAVLEPFSTDSSIRTSIIHNTPSVRFQEIADSLRPVRSVDRDGVETVVYLGKASPKHGTHVAAEALAICCRSRPDRRFRLVLTEPPKGSAAMTDDELTELLERLSLSDEQVQVLAPYPYSQAPAIMAETDIGLIAFTPDWGTDMTPNRLFEYMAAGIPSIIPDYADHMTPIVRETGAGIIVDTTSAQAIASAVLELIGDPNRYATMSEAARRAFSDRYSWEAETGSLRGVVGV